MSANEPSPRPSLPGRVWLRLCRVNLTHSRPTRRALERFVAEHATTARTLVVHSVDVDHARHFPDAFVVSSRDPAADLPADPAYAALAEVPDASFDTAVCTGLLEHLAEPQQLVDELHRIVRPGGRLVVSASAVFPFHGRPHDHFHFTPQGLRHLFREWSEFAALRGSTGPYTTLGVLVQRINLQCDVVPPVRLLNEVLMRVFPLLDVFVLREHDSAGRRDPDAVVQAAMPATLHAVVVR